MSDFSDKTNFHWNQLQKLKRELGYDLNAKHPDNIDHLLEMVKRIPLLPNQYAYINYAPLSSTVYVSPGIKEVLGYEVEEFEYRRQMDVIHPDDQPIIMASLKYYYPIFSYKVFKPFETSVFFDYRAKHKNGSVKKMLRYATPLEYNSDGKMIYHLCVVTDITEMQNTNRVHIWHKGLPDTIPFFPVDSFYDNNLLSKREMDILFYLCEGLNSLSISEKLFISRHTVDTHRRNILSKMKVDNTSQLIRKSIELELIPQSPVASTYRNDEENVSFHQLENN